MAVLRARVPAEMAHPLTRRCLSPAYLHLGNHAQRRSLASTPCSMIQHRLPAAYYRGGTSRAVMFKAQDLPSDRAQWAAIFRGVIGSPDPYGRQLDGMGGGISSLSKVCVVGPSTVGEAADVDYTFAAMGVKDNEVDFSSNCGNMSAAIGPFAVDSGLVVPEGQDGECVVRIHNTNTRKIIRSTFPVVGGEAAASGDFAIAGVAGSGAPVRLDFVRPGGSKTGKLLPTGKFVDVWKSLTDTEAFERRNPGLDGYNTADDPLSPMDMTCIDAGNPCVFVEAESLISLEAEASLSPGLVVLSPESLGKNTNLMDMLDKIRRYAAVEMGLAKDENDVPGSIPKISLVWTPRDDQGEEGDICVRALSVGQPHKAVPVTVALALAAAAQLPGTVVNRVLRKGKSEGGSVKISHPTGLLEVDAKYNLADGSLDSAAVFRTARRLMEGTIFWKP